ncbi:MAG: leucyl/phenylalanyl-tRNA--protein transferase [Phycisphaerales bacterium JB063]
MPSPPPDACDDDQQPLTLTPQLIVRAYLAGAFPMADSRSGPVQWYSPDPRAVIPITPGDPLGSFRVRRSLRKQVRNSPYTLTRDRAFADVIAQCAVPRENDGGETWISPEVAQVFTALHQLGYAHSVEVWHEGELVGGVYGLALGGAFFGESMFSRKPYASQLSLVYLVEHLRSRGYRLFDVQFVNPHLKQFGVVEIRRASYMRRLEEAAALPVTWDKGNASDSKPTA